MDKNEYNEIKRREKEEDLFRKLKKEEKEHEGLDVDGGGLEKIQEEKAAKPKKVEKEKKSWYESFTEFSNQQSSKLQYYYDKMVQKSAQEDEDILPKKPISHFKAPAPVASTTPAKPKLSKKKKAPPKIHPDEPVLFKHIRSFGYPIEKHTVLTSDGYHLALFRIKHARDEALKDYADEQPSQHELQKRRQRRRYPVLLQHGLFNSAATWTMIGLDSLAFQLSDAGYDVWMSNSRGVQYSRHHSALSPKDKQFWDFTFHDMQHDVLANVDFIRKTTQHEKIAYVGHSQGTTQMFIACSENPSLCEKISLFIALAPATCLKNQTNPAIKVLAQMKPDNVMEYMGLTEIAHRKVSATLLQSFSSKVTSKLGISNLVNMFMDCDFDHQHIDIMTQLEPSPTSYRNLTHWAQLCRSDEFRRRCYGSKENLRRYKSKKPPAYQLDQVKIPVAVFYGQKDQLANPKDIEQYLVPQLPKVIHQQMYNFKHNDFVWGKKSGDLYKHIMRLLLKFTATPETTMDIPNMPVPQEKDVMDIELDKLITLQAEIEQRKRVEQQENQEPVPLAYSNGSGD